VPTDNHLERKIGLFSATNIVIANMIGAGIFTTSGLLMENLGNPNLMIILWVFGGLIALSGALCYAEVGSAIPKAGGEYAFLTEMYHPLIGFLSGWVSFLVGFSAPIAASSIGFSEYLFRAFPDEFQQSILGPVVFKKMLSISLIVVFTFVHLRGVKFGSFVQNILTLLKVALLVGLIVLGFVWGQGNLAHFDVPSVAKETSGLDWKPIGLSLMWIMFAYSGWNATTYIGSEIKKPQKYIPGSLLLGTSIVLLFYFLLNVLFVYAIPADQMKGVISIGGLAVNNLFGPFADKVFSILIAIALFSSISAFIILGPRVYYAMARDGHFFRFAGTIHPKFKVPYWSIIFQAIISIVIILSGTLDQIFTYMGFTLGIFPMFVVAGLFKMRKSGKSALRLPGFPYTAILFLLVGVGMLFLSYLERPIESSVAIATLVIGLPFYFFFHGKNGLERRRRRN